MSFRRIPISFFLLFIVFSFMSLKDAYAQLKTKLEIVNQAKADAKHISCNLLSHKMQAGKNFLLIDTRTEREYLAGHIKGAVWISRGKLEFSILDLAKRADADIVLYCRSGARSSLAVLSLNNQGYTNVADLDGGFKKWIELGNSVCNMHGEFKVLNYLKAE
jgi:rhodanese-related sulfurtransferase